MMRLKKRAHQASIKDCPPYGPRRTFVSELFGCGGRPGPGPTACWSWSPPTTARYDRRGEAAKAQAAIMLHVPFRRNS